MSTRLANERLTIEAMIRLYCRQRHRTKELCPDCLALLDYSLMRLQKCPFGNGKTTCRKCTIHCYSPKYRTAIRNVMRYSGPRLLFHHPLLTIRHLLY